mgnify:CR=1 FL=1
MQEGQGLPAGAGSEPQGTTYLLQQDVLTANLFESKVTNSWQETNIAVDSVKQLAEQRHQEVVKDLTSMAEENHRREMAQVEGEASRKMHEHCVIHASAQEALKRELAARRLADMQQRESSKEEELCRLLAGLKAAQEALD